MAFGILDKIEVPAPVFAGYTGLCAWPLSLMYYNIYLAHTMPENILSLLVAILLWFIFWIVLWTPSAAYMLYKVRKAEERIYIILKLEDNLRLEELEERMPDFHSRYIKYAVENLLEQGKVHKTNWLI